MNKKLTIVVPAYNVEKYLEQTLESFLDERVLSEIEVLVVDDGSKDKTAEIARRYEARFPQSIRLISKENGGHGSTINRGIEEAAGTYFKVVDGDDWVEREGLYELVKALEGCEEDYILTDYYEVNDQTKEKTPRMFSELRKNCTIPFTEAAEKVQMPMHALVIRTQILKENQIRLDEHCFYVDVEYILYPVPYVNTVRYLDCFVYMYRLAVAAQSVSMAGYQKHIQNHHDVIVHLLSYLEQYEKAPAADGKKIDYMARRIAQMAESHINIFLSFPAEKEGIREQFQAFDKLLREKNTQVYEWTGEYSGMLRLLRKTGFRGYRLITALSRIRNK